MGRLFEGDSPTIEEIRKLRQPRSQSVALPLDSGLLAEIDDLERDLRIARKVDEIENRDPEAPALEERLEALRSEAESSIVVFTFRELPRKEYRTYLDSYPDPTGKRRCDDEALAPVLIWKCCTAPAMSLEDAQAIWDEWSEAATAVLYGACLLVNEGQSRIPFGVNGSGRTPVSVQSSTTAPSGDSGTLDS